VVADTEPGAAEPPASYSYFWPDSNR
jgi:hypothetical protein